MITVIVRAYTIKMEAVGSTETTFFFLQTT